MPNDIYIEVDGLGEIIVDDNTIETNESTTLENYEHDDTINLEANELEDFSDFVEWEVTDGIDIDSTSDLETTATVIGSEITFDYRTFIEGYTEDGVTDYMAVVFTFDKSGSMDDTQLEETRDAINGFIDEAVDDPDIDLYYTIVEYADDANMRSDDFVEATSDSLRAQVDEEEDIGGGTNFENAIEASLEAYLTTSEDLSDYSKSILHTSDGGSDFDRTTEVTIDGTEKSFEEHAQDAELKYVYSLVIYTDSDSEDMAEICRMIHSEEEVAYDDPNSGYYRTDVDGSNITEVYDEIFDNIKKIKVYQTTSDPDDNSYNNITITTEEKEQLATIMDESELSDEEPDLDISTCEIITQISNISSNHSENDIDFDPGKQVEYDEDIEEVTAKSTIDYDYEIVGIFEHDGYTLYTIITGEGDIDVDSNPHDLSGNEYGYFNEGETVDVEALPDENWAFKKWLRSLSGSNTGETVEMTNSKDIEAVFDEETYSVTVNILPDEDLGTYDIDPKSTDMVYAVDTRIKVEGFSVEGSEFDKLEHSGGLSNIDEDGTVIEFDITDDVTIDYYFDEILYKIETEIEGEGSLEVTPDPEDLSSPDYGHYTYGEEVEIEAINDTDGWNFDHWEEDLTSTSETEDLTMDEDKSVKAIFKGDKFDLVVDTEGEGEVYLEEIYVYETQDDIQDSYINRTYYKNDVIELTYKETDDCYYFDEWSHDLSEDSETEEIEFTEDYYVVANFKRHKYELNTSTEGEGSIEIDPSDTKFDCGSEIEVEAVADTGYVFEEWQGDISGTDKTQTFTITEDMDIEAVFVKDTFTIDLDIDGEGEVEITPDKSEYEYEEEVTLEATADSNWNFVSYTYEHESPVYVSTDKTQEIIMDEDKEFAVLFEEDEYLLKIDIVGQGEVEVTPDNDTYSSGEEITIEAIPESNWYFYSWTSKPELDLTDAEETFDITEDTHITAYFTQQVDKAFDYELINNRFNGMVESYKFNNQNYQVESNLNKIKDLIESNESSTESLEDRYEEYIKLKRKLYSIEDKINRHIEGGLYE